MIAIRLGSAETRGESSRKSSRRSGGRRMGSNAKNARLSFRRNYPSWIVIEASLSSHRSRLIIGCFAGRFNRTPDLDFEMDKIHKNR